jgi:hypothetical protein
VLFEMMVAIHFPDSSTIAYFCDLLPVGVALDPFMASGF